MSCEYPILTTQDLADFTGKPVASFSPYAQTAIEQAFLLFKMGTCLTQLPDDEQKQKLAQFAILEMAGKLYQEQKYADVNANPFSSESIGSYSYSKRTLQAVQNKQGTGVMWFDMAITDMSVCDAQAGLDSMSGGIHIFNRDGKTNDIGQNIEDFQGPGDYRKYSGWDVRIPRDPFGRQ